MDGDDKLLNDDEVVQHPDFLQSIHPLILPLPTQCFSLPSIHCIFYGPFIRSFIVHLLEGVPHWIFTFIIYLILCHISTECNVFQDEDDEDGDEGFGLDTVTESMMIAKMQVRSIKSCSLSYPYFLSVFRIFNLNLRTLHMYLLSMQLFHLLHSWF